MNAPTDELRSELVSLLRKSSRVAFLTGAGVSTNSGIPDFQTIDTQWPFAVDRTEATSLKFFHRDPRTFWEAYRYLFDLKDEAYPNDFHRAVAELEYGGRDVVVLTQNIDGLHTEAGSTTVAELHGNRLWATCARRSCPERVLVSELRDQAIPRCTRCRKFLRPDVCLFGEEPRQFGSARQTCLEADVLVVAGTALEVGPVNELPLYRQEFFPEAPMVWMNRDAAPEGYHFSHQLLGDLSSAAALLREVD